ncbi:hypothetical protein Q9966_013788 [Columba livia]|nr:hypothetical protein Q9966_013788 [Columba livia]
MLGRNTSGWYHRGHRRRHWNRAGPCRLGGDCTIPASPATCAAKTRHEIELQAAN